MSWLARMRDRLNEQYRVTIIKNLLYDHVGNYIMSLGGWLALFLAFVLVSAALATLLIFFTPLKTLIPGYPTSAELEKREKLATLVGNMEVKMAQQDSFIKSMRRITGAPELPTEEPTGATTATAQNPAAKPAPVEAPRNEPAPRLPAAPNAGVATAADFAKEIWLFPPVDGRMTGGFHPEDGHYAVDLVAPEAATIHAIADGVVVFSEYSAETGYVIGVYHSDRLLSFYKHNSRNLKAVGQPVRVGEAIAVIGNSGDHTTGPHLHFELWYNGTPVDPGRFFTFAQK